VDFFQKVQPDINSHFDDPEFQSNWRLTAYVPARTRSTIERIALLSQNGILARIGSCTIYYSLHQMSVEQN